MPDLMVAAASTFTGVLGAGAVLILGGALRVDAARRPALRVSTASIREAIHLDKGRSWLESELHRGGWRESPERVAAFAIALSGCLAILGTTGASTMPGGAAAVIGLFGALAGLFLPWLALRSEERRVGQV